MSATFTIRLISASATYSLRNEVLRPGRPATECKFPGDDSKGTFHLGIFKNDIIIGVASFMKNSNPFFEPISQFQLRGMAVLSKHKGLGIGSLLLKEGESKIKQENQDPFLWFNARVTAIDFYKKHGYESFGNKFEVPGVCEHIVMFKHFKSKKKLEV
ncbi:acetyltransferase (GNAT) family protein [Gillisia mitskevichiae]|uniref:Acetyltransferase (GNAT) family protein n=1 Tax=Gillisia mitskevichiae TaxID=270921 RepID=A0A495P011_9FLAO|nr:GNAT family N-acetyltransferase [Gillisia mitskevichiae]RKS43426.1 acetyltransferase (GNAT) family protein [Gillisia mitskevichiae]